MYDKVEAAMEVREAVWKDVFGRKDEILIVICMDIYEEEKTSIKRCIYHSQMEANGKFGKLMNKDVRE